MGCLFNRVVDIDGLFNSLTLDFDIIYFGLNMYYLYFIDKVDLYIIIIF